VAGGRGDTRWRGAVQEHRAALLRFLETANRLDADAWARPRAPGKWSPAQVAEHLALGYLALLRELTEGVPMRYRAPRWMRAVLRWVLLPHALFHRSLPVRAVAPREMRPSDTHPGRGEVLPRLREAAERFERALDDARGGGETRLTHPYFGTLTPVRMLRFAAVHLEHHRRQLSA
jgi:uncharacterized damage-inducible protein DinB